MERPASDEARERTIPPKRHLTWEHERPGARSLPEDAQRRDKGAAAEAKHLRENQLCVLQAQDTVALGNIFTNLGRVRDPGRLVAH